MKNLRNCKGAVAAIILMSLVSGCSHNDGQSTASAKLEPAAVGIQNNPNIPPQARAAVLHNLQTRQTAYSQQLK